MQPNRDPGAPEAPIPSKGWTDPQCPVARTLDLIGDRWTILIIRDAMDGAASFSDFHSRTGIARNILTDRLRRLVDYGILARTTAASGKRQTYQLTETGRSLFTVIVALRQWGEGHAFGPGEQHSILLDDHGTPVPELRPKSAAGRELELASTRVEKLESDTPLDHERQT